MRLSFVVLPILLVAAGCTDDSGTSPGSTAAVVVEPADTAAAPSIALEYSAKDPDAAQRAEKQCTVYGRTAKPRAAADGAKPNVVTFDCQ